jgi:hypothetical protein
MTLAPTCKRGYRPGGTRQYLLPRWLWLGLTRDMLRSGRRPVAADAERMFATWAVPPVVEGSEHIPPDGPLAVIANHYQRRGLWIGFGGGLLAREVRRARADGASVHFSVTDAVRLQGRALPGTHLLLERVARVWSMVPLPGDPTAVSARAGALRAFLRLALPPPRGRGEPVLFFPEGDGGDTSGLRQALPGTGSLLRLLAQAGVTVLPAAIWESRGVLHARFGAPWQPLPARGRDEACDQRLRADAMGRVALLLPPRLRGVYWDAGLPALPHPVSAADEREARIDGGRELVSKGR